MFALATLALLTAVFASPIEERAPGQQIYTHSGSSNCFVVRDPKPKIPAPATSKAGSSPLRAPRAAFRSSRTPICASTADFVMVAVLVRCISDAKELTSGASPPDGRRLVVKPCNTQDPCQFTFGNAQYWWGPQGDDQRFFLEFSGVPRIKQVKTGACITVNGNTAEIQRCHPDNTCVNDDNQLFSFTQHG
ncbi:hypothetical protein A1Q1_02529 [Trichosporon asahii var. asahii CBS 2479]|uniref:Uncharacterized protein n=1 Tax=Trichosporon asahii var. asahii (strain ATCC 90039 / CBS 2479 / JCM 2466 / KCTC 7840 / NBRC 103889/ NCYC 2677 / UAMH 7654) TaxID=1186058 RepID=J5QQ75_TRIAS|nr:hypothetical protein A1Q1_02529 [Trichosporon asahii var. asahii CBS 2479]EJT48508.1 hypothetical protein A1Q1_02529 [Trichosporon asahii var. asahii CBS 2479]